MLMWVKNVIWYISTNYVIQWLSGIVGNVGAVQLRIKWRYGFFYSTHSSFPKPAAYSTHKATFLTYAVLPLS